MKASEFTTHIHQAAAFTPGGSIPVARVTGELLASWADRFGGAPIVLPAMPLPPEVPQVQLFSTDRAWRFDYAPARITLLASGLDGVAPPISEEQFFREATERFGDFRRRFGVDYRRLAAIVTRVLELDAPGIAIARHFCAPRWQAAPLNRPEGFEIHSHKQYAPAGLPPVNSWFRVKTGSVRRAGALRRAVVVEQDINTVLTDAGGPLGDDVVDRFFRAMPGELDSILALYFPEEA